MGTLTIRTDADVDRALEALTSRGQAKSDVVRNAILLAERTERRARMRAEAEALRDDPSDAAQARQLASDMEQLSAW